MKRERYDNLKSDAELERLLEAIWSYSDRCDRCREYHLDVDLEEIDNMLLCDVCMAAYLEEIED